MVVYETASVVNDEPNRYPAVVCCPLLVYSSKLAQEAMSGMWTAPAKGLLIKTSAHPFKNHILDAWAESESDRAASDKREFQ